MIDDAIVERVARNADAGMAKRLGAKIAACARKTHHREVAGAAAEIRNQHGGIALEPSGEGERRADGLIDIARVAGAEAFERGAIALHGQIVVGIAAGKAHGPADRDVGHLEAELCRRHGAPACAGTPPEYPRT